jgi:hypothetical protein
VPFQHDFWKRNGKRLSNSVTSLGIVSTGSIRDMQVNGSALDVIQVNESVTGNAQ